MNLSITRNSNEDSAILTAAVKSIWPEATENEKFQGKGVVLAAWHLNKQGERSERLSLEGFEPHFTLIHRSLSRGSLTFGRITLQYYREKDHLSFHKQDVVLPDVLNATNFAAIIAAFHEEMKAGLGAMA